MTAPDLIALLPLLILAAASLAILAGVTVRRSHALAAGICLAGHVLSLAAAAFLPSLVDLPRRVTTLLVADRYGLFYVGLLAAGGAVVTAISYGYLAKREVHRDEYYLLLVLATLGGEVLALSSHFGSLFLGLEVLSVSLYTLIAYPRQEARSYEAALKYLVLAGASSAFLLFGMALVYAARGSMELPGALELPAGGEAGLRVLHLTGLALMTIGIGFKLAVVPFHMWTPDVYEGAPAPVTAFVATVSKGAMFALLLRYFLAPGGAVRGGLWTAFTVIAFLSMFAGNFLALLQTNVKRILAYSSIAHLGYLLVAFLAGGSEGVSAATYYLVAYFATTLSAFGVVTVLSGPGRDADSLDDYRGLFWRRPWTAAIFTATLLSLAGIPLTAGVLGKFYVVETGVGARLWSLVLVLVATSAIGLYYYLKVVVVMYLDAKPAESAADRAPPVRLRPADGVVLATLAGIVLWLGVYPGPLLDLLKATVGAVAR